MTTNDPVASPNEMKSQKEKRFDLKSLPKWQQYGIAILVVAAVVTLAVISRGDRPPPRWLVEGLIPVLGWIYLALLAIVLIRYFLNRKSRRR